MAKENMLGSWAFIIGVILAIVFAFFATYTWVVWVLLVIGVIIGLLNITDKEAEKFMWAGLVLVLISYFGGMVFEGVPFVKPFLDNMAMLFVPATIIVVMKTIFGMAKK